jgi:hypothetical protein
VLIEQLRALEEHGMVSRQPSAEHRQGDRIPTHPARRKPAARLGLSNGVGSPSRQGARRGPQTSPMRCCRSRSYDLTPIGYRRPKRAGGQGAEPDPRRPADAFCDQPTSIG